MKLITSTILIGIGALLPSQVQARGPIVNRMTYDSENGNICVSETSLDCTYLEGGVEKTCISEKGDDGKPVPWAFFPAEECGQLISATITMQMCNKNTAADKDILLYDMNINADEAQFLFKKVPYQFDKSQRILPGRCITIVKTELIEKCKVYPMQVKMLGNMPDKRPNDERAYCESFSFNKMKSKRIEQPILLPPQTFRTSPDECREVSDLINGGTNVCDSEVSIACTFFDEESNQRKSCIGPNSEFTFYTVREDLCGKKIEATIDMSICNKNPLNSGLIITPYDDDFSTRYTFKKINYNVDNRLDDLQPGECRSYRKIEIIDTCIKNWPMSVQLEGNMRNSVGITAQNSYCYCYLFKKARIEKIAPPSTPPPVPTVPTSPSPPPVIVPTPPPLCDETDVLITEIADPQSQSAARYIEVYFRDCAGVAQPKYVTEDIVVIRSPNNGNPIVKNLKGELIPPNGIIVICVNKFSHAIFFGYQKCDIEDVVANNDGTNPVDIRGNNGVIDTWIPMGFPLKTFQNGRALRIRPRTPSPRSTFEPSQWYIIPDPSADPATTGEVADPEGLDPGEWYNPLIITEIVDPVASEPARYITINQPFPEFGPIQDDLRLVIFDENTGEPIMSTAVPLKNANLDIAKNLKVCNPQYYQSSGDQSCILSSGLLPGTAGCYTVGIISILPDNNYSIVDLYGVRRQSCNDSPFDFTDGSAIRIPTGKIPLSIWNPPQWIIDKPDPPGVELFITEIADPIEGPNSRFVEIFVPGKPDYTIDEDLLLVRYENANEDPSTYPYTNLKGLVTDENGFIVLCVNSATYDGKCTVQLGFGSIADNPGDVDVAITKGLFPSRTNEIIDIYGVPGEPTYDFVTFVNGRVNRVTATPNPTFVYPNWEIESGSTTSADTDPGCWNGIGDCTVIVPPPSLKLIITELADPIDGQQNRFVELFSPDKRNYVIPDDLLLVRYEGYNSDPSPTPFVNLKGYKTDENGFIVLCVNSASYGNKCKYPLGPNTIADNPGNVDVAIVQGTTPSTTNTIIDIYGVPGFPAYNFVTFVNGRVNRNTDTPNPTFDEDNWTVFGSKTSADTDPGCWNGIGDCSDPLPPGVEIFITEIADPIEGPNSRFVEIFVPGKPDYTIDEDLLLVRYENANVDPSTYPYTNLRGLVTDENGFIVLCVNSATYDGKCTVQLGFGSIANSPGDVDVAITKGLFPSRTNEIVDIYGVPGEPTYPYNTFVKGRVNRVTDAENTQFDYPNWEIESGSTTSADTDPGCWNGIGNCSGPPGLSLKLIITEIADPSDGQENRFVELFSPDKKDYVIPDDLLLVRYVPSNADPSAQPFVNLKGYKTDENGFIVLCVNGYVYGNKCKYPLGFNTIADNPGNVDVAIVQGTTPSTTNTIIDIYGVPGGQVYSYKSFVNGRVNRNTDTPNPTFDFNNWEIMPGSDPRNTVPSSGADPGCWNGIGDCEPDLDLDLIITEIADPSDGRQNRFVELFSPTKKNYVIVDDVLLVRYEDTNADPSSQPFVNLRGYKTDEYGFIVLCVNSSVHGTSLDGTDKCKYPLGFNTIADNPGDVDVAIVMGTTPSTTNKIIDIYGVPGEQAYSYQSFLNGRVNRVTATQNPTFVYPNWEIESGTTTRADTDPGCWNGIGNCSDPLPPGPSLKLIITEIADPSDGQQNRFVELFSPDKKDYYIPDDLLLVRYEASNADPSAQPFLSLKGKKTDENGFIVLCAYGYAYDSDKCQYTLGYGSIADNPGNVDVAIVQGTTPSTTNTIIDIYGVPGEETYSYQNFVNGRVNRKTDTPNPTFDFNNWEIMPGTNLDNTVPSSGADPGCWNGIGDCSAPPPTLELIITEIADPYDGQQNRFVEIYFPFKRNYKIVEPLQLVRYELGSPDPTAPYPSLTLTGLTVNEYGFIVFCVNKANFGDKCDYELGYGSIADNPGNVDVAVVGGNDPALPGPIVDIYGIPGRFPDQHQIFSGGRAVRIRGPSSATWIINDWYIYGQPNNLVTFDDTDPGCWKILGGAGQEVGQCTPNVPPPSPGPPPTAPSKGKGKGKGSKSRNRVRKVRRLRRP